MEMDPKPISVLLIEDNPDDASLIQVELKKTRQVPIRLVHVDSLGSGLSKLLEGGFDVVLLDLNLPDGHGLDTLERLQARAPRVPVIVLTGHDDDEVAVEAVHKGAQDYLVKGQVAGGVLRRCILYAIERKKLLAEIERSAKEIRVLRGFLPICSNCKKIRDDKGTWTQLEKYINKYSGAEFTHGLCPECVKELYGMDYKEGGE